MDELESFRFGDSLELMDELLELVLAGKKTANCWAASEGDKGAAVGKRWIAKDGQGRLRVVLETVELTRRRSERWTRPSLTTRAKTTARSPTGARRTRPISPGEATFRRTWSFIASDSGWSRS